uniref:Uncharacterized protein n=1 Tax=Culex nigripalpus nucleopolyhedrovirus TaxID=130556 RepID=Q99GN9_NPVCN|nr:unknown [Culex nigripalpus nucleopolyhedrovirus]
MPFRVKFYPRSLKYFELSPDSLEYTICCDDEYHRLETELYSDAGTYVYEFTVDSGCKVCDVEAFLVRFMLNSEKNIDLYAAEDLEYYGCAHDTKHREAEKYNSGGEYYYTPMKRVPSGIARCRICDRKS